MDKIVASLLEVYTAENGIEQHSEEVRFEYFLNHLLIDRSLPEVTEVDLLHTGGGNDTGIDGFAVIVNGSLCTTTEDINAAAEMNGYVDAHFIFVQSKRTSGFSATEIGTFLFAVKDFFQDDPQLPGNDRIVESRELQKAVYEHIARMHRGLPTISMYYATTGRWQEDANLTSRVNSGCDDLQNLNLFSNIKFEPIDAKAIHKLYQVSQSKSKADFQFRERIVLPDIPEVEQAYLGVVQASEFVSMIQDEYGELNRFLFYDNVRDFQGENQVNKSIKDTLEGTGRSRFPIMNNGITIIAKSLIAAGNRFTIEDFQIVNGCQTSHILFDAKDQLTDDVYVPIKVIHTKNEDLVSQVIRATNNQTKVRQEQLYALSEFQKQLEAYYASFEPASRLYYERRSRQYNGVPGVEKVRIVSLSQQLRCFAAMFLDEPHRGHYTAALVGYIGDKVFRDDHKMLPYYLSAFALYKLEYYFRSGQIEAAYKPARYHMLQCIRYAHFDGQLPAFRSNEIDRLSQSLCNCLWDDAQAIDLFNQACTVIDAAAGTRALERSLIKTQRFTQDVAAELQQRRAQS